MQNKEVLSALPLGFLEIKTDSLLLLFTFNLILILLGVLFETESHIVAHAGLVLL